MSYLCDYSSNIIQCNTLHSTIFSNATSLHQDVIPWEIVQNSKRYLKTTVVALHKLLSSYLVAIN